MGKKYADALKLIEADKFYSPKEAVALVKKTAATKFDSTVEVAFRLGVNLNTLISKFVVHWFCRTALVNPRLLWFLLKAPKLQKQKLPAQISLAVKNMLIKSRTAGWHLTCASQPLI